MYTFNFLQIINFLSGNSMNQINPVCYSTVLNFTLTDNSISNLLNPVHRGCRVNPSRKILKSTSFLRWIILSWYILGIISLRG